MKTKGFTLWQLSLVLIILFVTAALLFPLFAKPRCKCRQEACVGNEKQIGLGILQYVQDNDELMLNIAEAPVSKNTWRNAIYPYIKSAGVFQCPDREDKTLGPDKLPRSYAANYSGRYTGGSTDRGEGAFAGPGSEAISSASFKSPASLITVCEVENSNVPEFNIDAPLRFGPPKHILWAGHKGGSNYLLADGHVKWYRPLKTQGLWYRDRSQPLSTNALAVLKVAQEWAGK